MKLYEITHELEQIERKLEEFAQENDGDITEFPLQVELETLEGHLHDKALNIATWIKNLTSDSKALSEEIKALSTRKRVIENKTESLKNYLNMCLEPGTKLENPQCKISWRKSQSVNIAVDTINLPEKYQKITINADKTGLKNDIKAGVEIPGVSLEEKQNIQIK